MKRSTDRILTTHSGSLVRPVALLDLMKAKSSGGDYDEAVYAATIRSSVADVVARQIECGIDIINDGEQSKASFTGYIRERLGGFAPAPESARTGVRGTASPEQEAFPEYYADYFALPFYTQGVSRNGPIVCVGPVTYTGYDLLQADIDNLKAAIPAGSVEEAFLPSTVPPVLLRGAVNQKNQYYATQEEYEYAVADAIREEYRTIVEAGLLVQIDGPNVLNASDLSPEEERKLVGKKIEILNYALRGIPEDRVRFHICYPPDMGPKIHDPSLRQIIEPMLRIHAGAYSFEASNARHFHDYHVFEDVKLPDGKVLIPGMSSHGHNLVEHPEYIAELTVNYARLVGRENVIIGTDCGFATQAAYTLQVDPKVGWAKFRAMAEGARLATSRLWGHT